MKRLSFYIIIISLIGLLPTFIQYGGFIVAKDFATQQIPFIIETKKLISSGTPFWSWNTYIGSNAIGAYSFYTLTSPYVWINALFPYHLIIIGITFTLILKLLSLGCTSFLYFRKMQITKENSIIGGLLYTFSSYTISNLGYYHFMEPMIVFPILLICLEKFLKRDNYGELYLCFGVFITAFINYYFLPCSIIPAGVYFLCRIFSKDINISYRRLCYAILFSSLGLLMASFIIIPTFFSMDGNPRVTTSIDTWLPHILERIRSLFMPKMLEQATPLLLGSGWNSNAAWLPIIGLLPAIIYCINNNNWIRWMVMISLCLYISPLNGVFSLFTSPSYTRWAYCLILFLILPSLKFLDERKRINYKQLIIYSFISISFIVCYYTYSCLPIIMWNIKLSLIDIVDNIFIGGMYIISLIFLFTYYKKQTFHRLLYGIIFFSIIYMPLRLFMCTDQYFEYAQMKNNINITNKNGYIKKYITDNNLSRKEDNNFHYRTNIVTRNSNIYPNIGMLKNRPSVSSYNSANYHYSRRILSTADTCNTSGYFSPNFNIDSFNALMSVKEIIIYNDSLRKINHNYQGSITKNTSDYKIIESDFYIPMGYTYTSYIEESQIDSLKTHSPLPDIPLQLLANICIKQEYIPTFKQFLSKGNIYPGNDLDSIITERGKIVCTDFQGTTKGFTAEANLPKENILFFSVPADKGFSAYINHKEVPIYEVNLGLSAIICPKGKANIEFKYFPVGLKEGIIISILALFLSLTISYIQYKYIRNDI